MAYVNYKTCDICKAKIEDNADGSDAPHFQLESYGIVGDEGKTFAHVCLECSHNLDAVMKAFRIASNVLE